MIDNKRCIYYSSSVGMNVPESFDIYDTSSSASLGFGSMGSVGGTGAMGGMGSSMGRTNSDVTVIGYSSHDAMTSFINGENVMYEGSIFDQTSADNSCVISYELAVLNDLAVGDAITVCNPQKEDQAFTLTICGIFQNETSDSYANTIFTSYASLNSIVADTASNAEDVVNERGITTTTALRSTINGVYVFTNVERYEAFCTDVEAMGLDTEAYTVSSSDLSQYEKSVVPLESLSKFTMVFFIVVLLVGSCVLVIFNMFTVRERKYEIGVLTAIGMKKEKVAVQFLTEAFMVTILAIVIGTGIGATASQPVGDYLLQEQITSAQATATATNQNFGGKFQGNLPGNGSNNGNMPSAMPNVAKANSVDYLDTLEATTDISVLVSLMGVSLLLTLLASSVGMISVLRYEPLEILNER